MPFDTKILKDRIEGIKNAFENGRFADALVAAVNTGNGLMQQRIFTQNKDVENQDFGTYKKGAVKEAIVKKNKAGEIEDLKFTYHLSPYQKKRVKYGRQILKKDLELFGSLRRSIETVIENEHSAVLQFNNNDSAKIARGQENQISNIRNGRKANTKGFGVRIFRLNTVEKEEVIEQGSILINQIIKQKQ